jgi:hypothetical protein
MDQLEALLHSAIKESLYRGMRLEAVISILAVAFRSAMGNVTDPEELQRIQNDYNRLARWAVEWDRNHPTLGSFQVAG